MWNKREPEPAAGVAPAAAPVAGRPAGDGRSEPVAIGASISIVGDVTGDEDLTILGRVDGTVNVAQHSVTVGRSARVAADIRSKSVTVEGEVRGNVVAAEQIVIRASATMLGDLSAPRVGLEDGCRFKGSVDMETSMRERARAERVTAKPERSRSSETQPVSTGLARR